MFILICFVYVQIGIFLAKNDFYLKVNYIIVII